MGTFWEKASLPFWVLVYSFLVISSSDHIFFWDTVQLASKQAHHFYEGSMWNFILPDAIDSGHLPFMGWILALCWHLLGKTLLISHLLMLPFVIMLIFQVHSLAEKVTSPKWTPALAGLLLLDPTVMAQCTLISPDIFVMLSFILMLNGILSDKRSIVVVGALLCVLASNRGAMVVAAMAAWQLFFMGLNGKRDLRSFIITGITFLPAIFLFLGFQAYHYWEKSWIGYHANSPWAASFDKVGVYEFTKNLALVGWRMADFGRWIFGLVLVLGFKKIGQQMGEDAIQKRLVQLLAFLSLFLLPSMLLHVGLTGHRYLLPIIIVVVLIAARYVMLHISTRFHPAFIFVGMISLITGNCWIYPKGVAQGWDASMAHLPYFELRTEMNQFLTRKKIQITEVGCSFPNLAEKRYLDLSTSTLKHAPKDLTCNPYFLYSNLYNDVTAADFQLLENDYAPIHTLKRGGIRMVLYQRK